MTNFPVSDEKRRWLKERMEALKIDEKDIEEKFVRSSGAGGQKVNKTSSCVYLRHVPTGIEVKCMEERSQSLNRFLARRELVKRVERLSGQEALEDVKVERRRRQKAKRKKRARMKYGGEKNGSSPKRTIVKHGNLFSNIPDSGPDEVFETLLRTGDVNLERIISSRHATPSGQWCDQDTNEWVILLAGSAGIIFKGEEAASILRPGDYLHIPAHCRHRVEWTDPDQKTVWLALHYR